MMTDQEDMMIKEVVIIDMAAITKEDKETTEINKGETTVVMNTVVVEITEIRADTIVEITTMIVVEEDTKINLPIKHLLLELIPIETTTMKEDLDMIEMIDHHSNFKFNILNISSHPPQESKFDKPSTTSSSS